MSLINKMLQDLDARGGDGARTGSSAAVRPVSYGSRAGLSPAAIGAGVVALAVLGGGGFAAWKYFRGGQQPASPAVAPPAPQAVPAGQVAIQREPAQNALSAGDRTGGGVGGPPGARVTQTADAKANRAGSGRAGDARALAGLSSGEAGQRAGSRDGDLAGAEVAPAGRAAANGAARGQIRDAAARGARPAGDTARRGDDGGRVAADAVNAHAAQSARAKAGRAVSGQGSDARPGAARPTGAKAVRTEEWQAAKRRERALGESMAPARDGGAEAGLSSQQKAENEYRRALAKLQDARVSEALAGLEQAVYLYPRHDAARQTLVSLLIEAGRTQEAIRHLTFATSLDPRQANMAMLLARLQLENGGNALDTLQRSLPYAESNPDYRALMAGILQRANRHKEAADHYQAAVRLQPGNAVWWMGMGISLQADKRNAEARVAFQRARDTGRLSPELQAFVERRLQQLN